MRQQQPDFVIPGGESRRASMIRGLAALESIREVVFIAWQSYRTAVFSPGTQGFASNSR